MSRGTSLGGCAEAISLGDFSGRAGYAVSADAVAAAARIMMRYYKSRERWVGRKRKEGRAKMVLKRELTESVSALGS